MTDSYRFNLLSGQNERGEKVQPPHQTAHARQQSPRAKEGAENRHGAEAAVPSNHTVLSCIFPTLVGAFAFSIVLVRSQADLSHLQTEGDVDLRDQCSQKRSRSVSERARRTEVNFKKQFFFLFYLFYFIFTIVFPKLCNFCEEINSN